MKKIIAFIMMLSVCLTMFVSCDSKRDDAIASFKGNYIYADDSDYKDFYNLNVYYYTVESGEAEMNVYEQNTIMREAIKYTVSMRLLEDEISRRGYSIDMAEVEREAREDEEIFEKVYTGGFETFCKHWNLSEDVFLTVNKFAAMQETAKEFFITYDKVTDEEALIFYEENERQFFKNPHYDVNKIFLQVLDPSSTVNKEAVFKDAQIYIEMLNSGKSWESVKETASLKYNLEHGMVFSHYLTGEEMISKSDFVYVNSFNSSVKELNDKFEYVNGMTFLEMFPRGFETYADLKGLKKNTIEYNKEWQRYVNYCSERYLLEFRYAITEFWETGKTYSLPIYHGVYDSYVIVTFTYVEDDMGFITFEKAKDGIIAEMENERKTVALEDYISKMLNEANVQIKYGD